LRQYYVTIDPSKFFFSSYCCLQQDQTLIESTSRLLFLISRSEHLCKGYALRFT